MNNMKFSCAYHKRRCYTKNRQVPPFAEARSQLGNDLTQVLMDECPESLKTFMNLSNPLEGPYSITAGGPSGFSNKTKAKNNNLWMSPSDLLIPRVALSPPLTAKHLKALTHEGILEMGEQIEQQWLNAVELEKRLALENLEDLLQLLAEREKERAIEEALRHCEELFRKHMEAVNADFEELLIFELARLEASMREYYENLIEDQVVASHQMQDAAIDEQIQDAINATVAELTAKFMEDLKQQERDLETVYRGKIAGLHERHMQTLKYQADVFAVVLKQLKHSLQCNSIASLMYVICLERRKCMKEEQFIIQANAQKIHDLLEDNIEKTAKLKELYCQNKLCQKRLEIRTEALLGLMTQFQKFINYALKATPTQAEFFLSIEKMMTLEITQALENFPTDYYRRKREEGKLSKPMELMAWKQASSVSLMPGEHAGNLRYHDCLNELPPPKDPNAEEDLFVMQYKDKLYVREDFRNQITQGILPSNSTLWSKDVQDLVKLIQDVNKVEIEKQIEENRKVLSIKSINSVVFVKERIEKLREYSKTVMEDVASLNGEDDDDEKVSVSAILNNKIDFSEGSLDEKVTSNIALLAACDSLTLFKDKKSSFKLSVEGELDDSDLKVVPAPSTATIQIKKQGPRRVTRLCRDDAVLKQVPQIQPEELTSHLHDLSNKQSKTKTFKTPPLENDNVKISGKKVSKISHIDSLELINASAMHIKKLKNIINPSENVMDDGLGNKQMLINAPPDDTGYPAVNFERVAEVFTQLYVPDKPWGIYRKSSARSSRMSVSILKEKSSFETKRKFRLPSKINVLPIPPKQGGKIYKKQKLVKKASESSQQEIGEKENYLEQPRLVSVMGIVGSYDGIGRKEIRESKDFTLHRVHSILDVLTRDDSLIRMFTKGTQ